MRVFVQCSKDPGNSDRNKEKLKSIGVHRSQGVHGDDSIFPPCQHFNLQWVMSNMQRFGCGRSRTFAPASSQDVDVS